MERVQLLYDMQAMVEEIARLRAELKRTQDILFHYQSRAYLAETRLAGQEGKHAV